MDDEFSIFSPSRFLNDFVLRAYREHLKDPSDRYHIKVAVHQANVLAERVWSAYRHSDPNKIANSRTASAYRTYLSTRECSDFQLIWDLDDGHKHVVLSRRNRKVTSAAQTGMRHSGGAFDVAAFDADAFDTGRTDLVVQLDDGTERAVAEILESVIAMWERLVPNL